MAELLNNPAFAPVVSDLDGNITVRARPSHPSVLLIPTSDLLLHSFHPV